MKELLLKTIIKFIINKNNLNLNSNAIEKELINAGFSDIVRPFEVGSIEKAVNKLASIKKRLNPLKITASLFKIECPLCSTNADTSNSLVTVKLYKNRLAKFCTEHNVTIPCSVEK